MGEVINVEFGKKSRQAPIESGPHFADRFHAEIDGVNESLIKAGCEEFFFAIDKPSATKANLKLYSLPEFGEKCVEEIKVTFADSMYHIDWGDQILRYSSGEMVAEVSRWAIDALKRHMGAEALIRYGRMLKGVEKPDLSLV